MCCCLEEAEAFYLAVARLRQGFGGQAKSEFGPKGFLYLRSPSETLVKEGLRARQKIHLFLRGLCVSVVR